jgi:hypothetical protein
MKVTTLNFKLNAAGSLSASLHECAGARTLVPIISPAAAARGLQNAPDTPTLRSQKENGPSVSTKPETACAAVLC